MHAHGLRKTSFGSSVQKYVYVAFSYIQHKVVTNIVTIRMYHILHVGTRCSQRPNCRISGVRVAFAKLMYIYLFILLYLHKHILLLCQLMRMDTTRKVKCTGRIRMERRDWSVFVLGSCVSNAQHSTFWLLHHGLRDREKERENERMREKDEERKSVNRLGLGKKLICVAATK